MIYRSIMTISLDHTVLPSRSQMYLVCTSVKIQRLIDYGLCTYTVRLTSVYMNLETTHNNKSEDNKE